MASRGGQRYDPLSSCWSSPIHASRICLACIGGVTAPFSGEVFDCTLPCTGTKDLACQIFHHLSAWNEVLIQGFYELRERARTRPELVLASIDHCARLRDLDTVVKVATLLYILIKKHHCVTAVDVVIGRLKVYDAFLCDALRDNEHVRDINLLYFMHSSDNYYSFFSVIPSLKNLKQFKYKTDAQFQLEHMEALESTLEKTNTLEALLIPGLWNNHMDSTHLVTAITARNYLRELSLNFSFLDRASDECCGAFSEYLKDSATLTTLSLDGECDFGNACGKVILRGLRENKSILKLEIDEMFADDEGLELIASIFAQNTVLRSFRINPDVMCGIEGGGYCDSWLPSVTQNDTVQEMTLPFPVWRAEQWLQLFGTLATKQSLKSITVGWRDMLESDLNEFCKAVCESGVEEKVTFTPEFELAEYGNNLNLLRCKSFVDIWSRCAAGDPLLKRLVDEVSVLSQVTALTLIISIHPTDKNPLSPIADLIETTTTLKTLDLFVSATDISEKYKKGCWTDTIKSLSVNRSISNLGINSPYMEPKEMEYLADVIRCSQRIRSLSICLGEERLSDHFQKHLSRGITDNYTLVSVESLQLSDKNAFAIRDTARRNCGLVARVSQFQMGARLERVTASALERVYRHRALLEEFADLECISVEKAAAALRAALSAFDDMHSFMRMAGVVRSSVVCHTRQDGRTQLGDLNEPCWRALRDYLFLDYVVT